jgi:hypothetical protein
MTTRTDLLPECIPQGVPLDAFKTEWCDRCVNPECVRSQVGSSKFEVRVKDWEEKLFKNPPVMDPNDPLFVAIAGKRFITIDPGRMPEIRSSWIDPQDIKEPEPVPEFVSSSEPAPEPQVKAREPSPPKPETSPRSTLALVGENAPDQSGKILRGAPGESTTKADPWAPADPPDPADVVVQPGARIKVGRSGV